MENRPDYPENENGILKGLKEALAYVRGELTEDVTVHTLPDDSKPNN